jgi:thiamine kinase-like enzyme
MEAVRAAMAPLHGLASTATAISDHLVEAWVTAPAATLRTALESARLPATSVGALADELTSSLSGRTLNLGWTHGDLHPGNVLVSADGTITGLIDWIQAREADLAELDLALWLLTATPRRNGSLGIQVAHRLRASTVWTPEEQNWIAADAQLPPRATLLLTWLRHVSGNLAKSDRYGRSGLWLRRAVRPVLGALQP